MSSTLNPQNDELTRRPRVIRNALDRPDANPVIRKRIAEQLLGTIEWGPHHGEAECPGANQHTNKGRGCRIYVEDGAPTIHCLHQSCAYTVADTNFRLRSEIGRAERGMDVQDLRPQKTPAELEAQRRRAEAWHRKVALETQAKDYLREAQQQYQWTVEQAIAESPVRLPDPPDHWRLLLSLFQPEDVVWIGNKQDSGYGKSRHFRRAEEWLSIGSGPPPYQFTCPSMFAPGTFSRCNDSVLGRRFLVVESDIMSKDHMLAVIRWMASFLRLRAIVDTGGKSIHGWFESPNLSTMEELSILLPAMGLDRALFVPSQPVRLPSAIRNNGNWQRLLWFGGAR